MDLIEKCTKYNFVEEHNRYFSSIVSDYAVYEWQ